MTGLIPAARHALDVFGIVLGLKTALQIMGVKVDGAPPGSHWYLSTGCLHGDHDYCKAMTGAQGTKRPAVCKFCEAPCRCLCHMREAAS